MQQDSSVRSGTALCSGPNRNFVRNSPKSTNLSSKLSGTVNLSSFSTANDQTLDDLDTSYVSKQNVQEVICLETAELSSSKVNSKDRTSLSHPSEMSFNNSWCEKTVVRNGERWHLPERPITSTAVKVPSKAPAGTAASDCLDVNDTDFDLDNFDIDDFDEGWENSVTVSAPETPSAPLYQPVREGPPARSLLSKIISAAKGSPPVSNPVAPKSSCLTATKNQTGKLCEWGLLFFLFNLCVFMLSLRPSNLL